MIKSLEDLGVTRIFGYTGATILPVFHALGQSPLAINVNSNEQSCAFSAAGYSNETVYPLIPQGKGYKDMILGPYIKKEGTA